MIGIKIKRFREQMGCSQEGLAEKIYVSRQTIIRWEKGETLPDSDNIRRLASVLEIPADELLSLNKNSSYLYKRMKATFIHKGNDNYQVEKRYAVIPNIDDLNFIKEEFLWSGELSNYNIQELVEGQRIEKRPPNRGWESFRIHVDKKYKKGEIFQSGYVLTFHSQGKNSSHFDLELEKNIEELSLEVRFNNREKASLRFKFFDIYRGEETLIEEGMINSNGVIAPQPVFNPKIGHIYCIKW